MYMEIKDLNRKYKKSYTIGLNTKPDPSILAKVTDDMYGKIDYVKETDPVRETMDANRAIIRGWNDSAKMNKTLVGRTISEGMGDGYGIYVVVKENRQSLKLKVCRNIGDDWTPWGDETLINKQQALQYYLQDGIFGTVEA